MLFTEMGKTGSGAKSESFYDEKHEKVSTTWLLGQIKTQALLISVLRQQTQEIVFYS